LPGRAELLLQTGQTDFELRNLALQPIPFRLQRGHLILSLGQRDLDIVFRVLLALEFFLGCAERIAQTRNFTRLCRRRLCFHRRLRGGLHVGQRECLGTGQLQVCQRLIPLAFQPFGVVLELAALVPGSRQLLLQLT
jgi:hypothetical protein